MHLQRLVRSRLQRHTRGSGQRPCRHDRCRRRRLVGQLGLPPLVTLVAVTAGILTHRPVAGAVVAAVLLVALAVRARRGAAPVPGPGRPPGGGSPDGTAGVREPRHPRPSPPAGALALPVPPMQDDELAALA